MILLTEATITTEASINSLMLIQFGSELCPACICMKSILERLEQRIKKDRIVFAHVDIDESPFLEQQFEIAAAPTLIVVKENRIVGRHEGQMDDKETRKFIMGAIVSNQDRRD